VKNVGREVVPDLSQVIILIFDCGTQQNYGRVQADLLAGVPTQGLSTMKQDAEHWTPISGAYLHVNCMNGLYKWLQCCSKRHRTCWSINHLKFYSEIFCHVFLLFLLISWHITVTLLVEIYGCIFSSPFVTYNFLSMLYFVGEFSLFLLFLNYFACGSQRYLLVYTSLSNCGVAEPKYIILLSQGNLRRRSRQRMECWKEFMHLPNLQNTKYYRWWKEGTSLVYIQCR
jgi:hypothetical protein